MTSVFTASSTPDFRDFPSYTPPLLWRFPMFDDTRFRVTEPPGPCCGARGELPRSAAQQVLELQRSRCARW